jgi:hypothetical protein
MIEDRQNMTMEELVDILAQKTGSLHSYWYIKISEMNTKNVRKLFSRFLQK